MINTLNYPIQLNVTLNGLNGSLIERLIEPSQPWWININPLLAALLGAIAAGLFQFLVELWRNGKSNRDNKIIAHSNLLGCKHAILQCYNSYFISIINAENSILHARLTSIKAIDFTQIQSLCEQNKIEEANQYSNQELMSLFGKSHSLKEGLKERERTKTLELLIADTGERFWKIIGQIKILFSETEVANLIKEIEKGEKDLENLEKDLIEIIEKIDTEIKKECGSIHSIKDRDSWIDIKTKKLNNEIDSKLTDINKRIYIFNSKIDNLLNYLDERLARKNWWQFWR